MGRPLAITLALAAAAALAGCGDDTGSVCEACASDAGTDAATVDAAPPDARSAADAGCPSPCGDPASVVVDPQWLEDHLADPGLQVIDTRSAAAHVDGRIPGALRVDPSGLRATVEGVAGQVAPAADVQAELRAAGVERDARVVIYDGSTTTTPARVFWTLEHYGHAGGVLFLDGGWGRWVAEGRATESGEVTPTPSDYTIDGAALGTRVDADWVLAALDDESVVLIDARSDSEYASGHIPGAVSLDWMRNVDGGSLRPEGELETLYAGFDPDATFVAYCQTGSRASVSYLVLRHLGFGDVRLYDGSWAEWGSRGDLPREP